MFLILVTIFAVFGIAYLWIGRRYKFWEDRGFSQLKNVEFPFGNMKGIGQDKHMAHFSKEVYEKYKKSDSAVGFYLFISPSMFIVNLDLIKNMLLNDFNHFVDRGTYFNAKSDPLSANLFSVHGDYWRNLRAKLTSTFTSGKMKVMFNTVLETSNNLVTHLKTVEGQVDCKDIFARYTTDVIGSVAFGIDTMSFKNDKSEFMEMGKKIITLSKFDFLKANFLAASWNFAKHFPFRVFPKDSYDFFKNIVTESIDYREKVNLKRNDFLNLLIQLKNAGKLDDEKVSLGKLTMDEVIAQCALFFLAGYDTSSSLMSFASYELAKNPEVQEKVRREINDVLKRFDGKITYESISEMKYLQMMLDETMRLYPALENLLRKCTKEYKIPNTNLVIPEGTFTLIPIFAIHRDPEIYPDPEKFDPERFSEENKSQRHPMSYLPFGDGPRVCIGLRFGYMQSKIGMVQLLTNFKLSVCDKTPILMEFHTTSLILTSKAGIWLNIEKL